MRGDLFFGLARILLGILFVYMGLIKALHPEDFLKLVHTYNVIGSPFALNLIAAVLPWFETLSGLFLLVGIGVRGTALILASMLVPFTILVAWRGAAIAAQAGIAYCSVKFDCGCGAGEVFVCNKLVENVGLTVLSLALALGKGRWMALRYDLLPDSQKTRIPT